MITFLFPVPKGTSQAALLLRVACMGLGLVALWLGFPNTYLHIPFLALGYPLALTLLGRSAVHALDALRMGWICGLLGAFAALYWLAIPIHNVGGLPMALAIPCAFFMAAYTGLYGGIYSAITWFLNTKRPASLASNALILACTWYGLELLRASLFTGFPWLTLSAAFVPLPLFIQGASMVGAFALSAVWVYITLLLSSCFYKNIQHKQRLCLGIPAICLFIAILAYGNMQLAESETINASSLENTVQVVMIEGNVDQNVKWEPHLQKSTLELYINLSTQALQTLEKENSDIQKILIWPETAMPFYLDRHPEFSRNLLRFIRESQIPLLVGAPGAIVRTPQHVDIFNRAYLFTAKGILADYYDKEHLVPFGEYVPAWLAWNFLEPLLQGIGTFTIGEQTKALRMDKLALGMLICYEGVFPYLAQKRIADGANILLNISNDGWFGDSSAPEQHLQLTIMRAVEQGRFLVRSTNTGISAIVDHKGRFHLRGTQFKAQSLIGKAALRSETTFFHKYYSFIPWIILTIGCMALWFGRSKNI